MKIEKREVEKWADKIHTNIDTIELTQVEKENLIKELVTCETWEQVVDIKFRYNLSK